MFETITLSVIADISTIPKRACIISKVDIIIPSGGGFLNADGYVNANGDIIGFNMYAYCSNNPVMHMDPTGEAVITTLIANALIGAAIGGGFVFIFQMISNGGNIKDIDLVKILKMAFSGVVSGLMGAYFCECGIILARQATSKFLQTCYN